jgi:hypothetical protein
MRSLSSNGLGGRWCAANGLTEAHPELDHRAANTFNPRPRCPQHFPRRVKSLCDRPSSADRMCHIVTALGKLEDSTNRRQLLGERPSPGELLASALHTRPSNSPPKAAARTRPSGPPRDGCWPHLSTSTTAPERVSSDGAMPSPGNGVTLTEAAPHPGWRPVDRAAARRTRQCKGAGGHRRLDRDDVEAWQHSGGLSRRIGSPSIAAEDPVTHSGEQICGYAQAAGRFACSAAHSRA